MAKGRFCRQGSNHRQSRAVVVGRGGAGRPEESAPHAKWRSLRLPLRCHPARHTVRYHRQRPNGRRWLRDRSRSRLNTGTGATHAPLSREYLLLRSNASARMRARHAWSEIARSPATTSCATGPTMSPCQPRRCWASRTANTYAVLRRVYRRRS